MSDGPDDPRSAEPGAPFPVPDGWTVVEGRLHRELRFADFAEAFAFMVEVAAVAEAFDHHPDWSNSWNLVVIDLLSHDVGSLTERDRALAEAIEAIAAGR